MFHQYYFDVQCLLSYWTILSSFLTLLHSIVCRPCYGYYSPATLMHWGVIDGQSLWYCSPGGTYRRERNYFSGDVGVNLVKENRYCLEEKHIVTQYCHVKCKVSLPSNNTTIPEHNYGTHELRTTVEWSDACSIWPHTCTPVLDCTHLL